MKILFIALALIASAPAFAQLPTGGEYIPEGALIKMTTTGQVSRAIPAAALRAFRAVVPCPFTNSLTGDCAGFKVDFIIPPECFGALTANNLYWRPLLMSRPVGGTPVPCSFTIKCK